MPGFGGAIANALAQGVAEYGTQAELEDKENTRRRIAASILARQQQHQDKEDAMKLLELRGKYGYTPGGQPTDIANDGASTALDNMPRGQQPTSTPTPQVETPDPSTITNAPSSPNGVDETPARARILQALKMSKPTVVSTPDVQPGATPVLKQPGLPTRGVTQDSFDPSKSEAGVLAGMRGQQSMDRARMLEQGRNQRYADGLLTKQDVADMVAEGKQEQVDAYTQAHDADRSTRVLIAGMPARATAATAGDTPQAAASRKDLKDTAGQQIRAEHEVQTIKNDRTRRLKGAATAADSSRVIKGSEADLNAAEGRARGLRQRADSILNVIPQQRAAGLAGAPATAPAVPAATTTAPAPKVDTSKADYDAAAAKYQAALKLPGMDPAAAREAYDQTVALIAKKHGQVP